MVWLQSIHLEVVSVFMVRLSRRLRRLRLYNFVVRSSTSWHQIHILLASLALRNLYGHACRVTEHKINWYCIMKCILNGHGEPWQGRNKTFALRNWLLLCSSTSCREQILLTRNLASVTQQAGTDSKLSSSGAKHNASTCDQIYRTKSK